MSAQDVVADFLERAGWTAGQTFVSTLLAGAAGGGDIGLPWGVASVMAVGAAVVSILTTAVQYLSRRTELDFWPDLLVRLGKTFLSSIVGSIGADAFDVLAFDWGTALNVATLAVLTALAKGLLARGQVPTTPADGQRKPEKSGNPSTLPLSTYLGAVAAR